MGADNIAQHPPPLVSALVFSMYLSFIFDNNNITLYADAVNHYFDEFIKKIKILYQSIIKHFNR